MNAVNAANEASTVPTLKTCFTEAGFNDERRSREPSLNGRKTLNIHTAAKLSCYDFEEKNRTLFGANTVLPQQPKVVVKTPKSISLPW